eukprot:CAMPEP_0115888872 /NCGR_PEP_ID=MMETSP0287-20121206/32531_1 /TAXON_ID=412157 /ORGANISM="Chrysochromulina rotalis, Strain UIO044" /LENGTH=223 /DNA_ID=CAMNT_0003345569 /DNA_START=19 /DNA_END=688 /DNA_ORIENTATION=+
MTSVATRAKVMGGGAMSRIGQRNPAEYKATPAERLTFAFGSLIGLTVTVHLQNGELYEGVLCSGWWTEDCPSDAKDEPGVVLKAVAGSSVPNDERTLVARSIGDGVLADTEIEVQGRGAGQDRELVAASAWLGEDSAVGSLDSGGVQRGWDQFAVNEKLGHKSNYSDELYTTKLRQDYTPEQLAKAAKLAKEIEKGDAKGNKHILEERGLKELDDNDDDADEE